jgi:hypothetical protein
MRSSKVNCKDANRLTLSKRKRFNQTSSIQGNKNGVRDGPSATAFNPKVLSPERSDRGHNSLFGKRRISAKRMWLRRLE